MGSWPTLLSFALILSIVQGGPFFGVHGHLDKGAVLLPSVQKAFFVFDVPRDMPAHPKGPARAWKTPTCSSLGLRPCCTSKRNSILPCVRDLTLILLLVQCLFQAARRSPGKGGAT